MATVQATPRSQIITVSDLPWETRQPGVAQKALWSDAATKRRAVLSRVDPSARPPRHRHAGDELVFVIEGALSDDFATLTPGNVGYRPDGCVHTISTKHGATVLAILTGGVEPITSPDHGPASRVITVSDLPWFDALPGVRQKKIWEDALGGRRLLLSRFEPGAALPLHRHAGDEVIFVVEGAIADESGEVATGNANYRPNGCVHRVTTKHGATVLAMVWGGIELI
jgi:anti-sigma factor ChrR (cupin superfamily)